MAKREEVRPGLDDPKKFLVGIGTSVPILLIFWGLLILIVKYIISLLF